MKNLKTNFKGLEIFDSKNIYDHRGYFRELFLKKKTRRDLIFTIVSKSKKNVLRGMHMQSKKQQGKYVSVVKGKILDVCVDCRKNSKTYGKYFSIELSSENNKQLLVPKGFAHGFQVLSNEAIVNYKVDEYYNPDSDSGIIWNDKDLSIDWNLDIKPVLSVKDLKLISFKELKSPF